MYTTMYLTYKAVQWNRFLGRLSCPLALAHSQVRLIFLPPFARAHERGTRGRNPSINLRMYLFWFCFDSVDHTVLWMLRILITWTKQEHARLIPNDLIRLFTLCSYACSSFIDLFYWGQWTSTSLIVMYVWCTYVCMLPAPATKADRCLPLKYKKNRTLFVAGNIHMVKDPITERLKKRP
jgi:hypothetical protein